MYAGVPSAMPSEASVPCPLELEPVGADARRQLGGQHLHHHLAAEPHFFREEYAAHAAAAELLVDSVRGAEGRLEAVAEVEHGPMIRLQQLRSQTLRETPRC